MLLEICNLNFYFIFFLFFLIFLFFFIFLIFLEAENIPVTEFLECVKRKERRLMGFGHRVYKNFDPRATAMAKICHKLLKQENEQKHLYSFIN